MSLLVEKRATLRREDLTPYSPPVAAPQPESSPRAERELDALQTGVGNAAVAHNAARGASTLTPNTPQLQSTLGNAAVMRGAATTRDAGEQQRSARDEAENSQPTNRTPAAADAAQVDANTAQTAERRGEASQIAATTLPANETAAASAASNVSPTGSSEATAPDAAASSVEEAASGSSAEGVTGEAQAVTGAATAETATKAEEVLAATEESVAAVEADAAQQQPALPAEGETDPMPSLLELLGNVEQGNSEETSEELSGSPAMSQGETEADFGSSPSFASAAAEVSSQPLLIQRKPDFDAGTDVTPNQSSDPSPVSFEESSSEVSTAAEGTGSEPAATQPRSSADTRGMAEQIAAAAAAAQQRIETQAETVRSDIGSRAEMQRQSIQAQVQSAIATIRGAFEAERAALDVAVNTAREQVNTGLASRLAEALSSGEEAKTKLGDLYATRRGEIEEAVQSNITAAEQMRSHYADMVRTRTREQASEARRRGETKAATYSSDERGRVQAEAALGVANGAANEIEQRGPEAVAAIEEVVSEIPQEFAEKGADALSHFDEGLPELIERVDEQVRSVSNTLNEKAAQANVQLDALARQLHAQLDALETASVARAEAVGPQAEAQTENALHSALEQLDTSTPEAVAQVNQAKEEATQALLSKESPDPTAAQSFTNEAIAFINEIAASAGGGLQQAGGSIGGGFQNVETATSQSLSGLEQQVFDDLATMRGERDSALSGLVDGLDTSFGESIDTLRDGFTATESEVDGELSGLVQDLRSDFADALRDAEDEIVEAVDEGLSKNDEALAELGPAMQEAADDAAWDHDHPILAGIRDVGMFILGALAAIVVLVLAIVVVILLFKALAVAAAAGSILAAIAQVVLVVGGLALLVYGVYEAYQARVRAGEGGGWGTFGMALLDMTGVTSMYRAFTQPGLSPFERGWMFGRGLVELVSTLLLVRGAWRFVRTGGLRTAWQSLWRGAGRLARGIGRGIQSFGRGAKGLWRAFRGGGLGGAWKWLRRRFTSGKTPPKKPTHRAGISSVEDIFNNPWQLEGKTPSDVRQMILSNRNWVETTLGRGSHAGQGVIFRESGTGRMIQWHPGGGHHGPHPYWKVSSGPGGTVRVGPQFRGGGGEQ